MLTIPLAVTGDDMSLPAPLSLIIYTKLPVSKPYLLNDSLSFNYNSLNFNSKSEDFILYRF